jgi:hypothetical protein
MDKIEKLELPYDDGKGNFSSGAGEIQIIRKVNEIIDVLNSQLFEPKILNYPTDQSQKQPEGVMDGYVETVGTPVLESTTTYSNTEPEKQEEWREELFNLTKIVCNKIKSKKEEE